MQPIIQAGVNIYHMDTQTIYMFIAELVLLLHTLFVGFVIIGLLLIIIGKLQNWNWIFNPWFRLLHIIAIGIVVLQSWLGMICPLTTVEQELRERAGDDIYSGSFIAHWLETILYYQAPAWVFITIYTLFGAAVLASWFWAKPRPFSNIK